MKWSWSVRLAVITRPIQGSVDCPDAGKAPGHSGGPRGTRTHSPRGFKVLSTHVPDLARHASGRLDLRISQSVVVKGCQPFSSSCVPVVPCTFGDICSRTHSPALGRMPIGRGLPPPAPTSTACPMGSTAYVVNLDRAASIGSVDAELTGVIGAFAGLHGTIPGRLRLLA
jgi:hypothetical protein